MSSHASDPSMPDRGHLPHHHEVPFQPPDPSTPAGEKILRRLREELFLWLITVDATGTPHTLPVAFLWDEVQSTFLIYSAGEEDLDRRWRIQQNPKVGLHFNLDLSADSFILTGEAKVSLDDPSSDQVPAWVAKYEAFFSQMGGLTIQQLAVVLPVALRVRPLTMMVQKGTTQQQ